MSDNQVGRLESLALAAIPSSLKLRTKLDVRVNRLIDRAAWRFAFSELSAQPALNKDVVIPDSHPQFGVRVREESKAAAEELANARASLKKS